MMAPRQRLTRIVRFEDHGFVRDPENRDRETVTIVAHYENGAARTLVGEVVYQQGEREKIMEAQIGAASPQARAAAEASMRRVLDHRAAIKTMIYGDLGKQSIVAA